jgi:hypothetical protein
MAYEETPMTRILATTAKSNTSTAMIIAPGVLLLSFSHRYFPGVIEGIYWAVVTASTVGYGDRVARSWPARLLSLFLIFFTLPVFAYFITTLSSNITVQKLRTTMGSPLDLVERRVGVLDEGTSQNYMQEIKAEVYSFDRIDNAYNSPLPV